MSEILKARKKGLPQGDVPVHLSSDFEFFSSESSEETSLSLDEIKSLKAKNDGGLVRSRSQLILFYLVASMLGYFVTLAICAQNSVGISAFSHSFAMRMCLLKTPFCWIVCGALFTGIPALLSMLFLNRFQHRYLLSRLWWLVASIPLVTAFSIVVIPRFLGGSVPAEPSMSMMMLNDPTSVSIWLLSALVCPFLLEGIAYLALRQRKWNGSKLAIH